MSWDLVADIGGTRMRVAQVVDGDLAFRRDFKMQPGRSITVCLDEVVRDLDGVPDQVICAGAGPKLNGEIRLTNGGWLLSEAEIAQTTGARHVQVINDFAAAAWSVASIQPAHIEAIGASGVPGEGHRIVLGPGTGLGVGALLWQDGRYFALPGEGGHVGIGPLVAEDVAVFEALADIWPETRIGKTLTFEAEALLSGTGLPKLYQAVSGVADIPAAQIFARRAQGEAAALRTIDLFRAQLASLAGDLAVTFKAFGGVFIVGGVAQANSDMFDAQFWDMFSQGGRFTELRARCGIYLVQNEDFGLRGCANALQYEHAPA